MPKVIFILQRKPGMTRDACLKYWAGERHTSIVRTIPGLARWVQNHVISAPGEPACDGVGELWFENDKVMRSALNSPAMAAAVEDAKNFLDMEKTGLVIVEEKTVIGVM
jgi:uncharacterized protein (TIGR02118 family)